MTETETVRVALPWYKRFFYGVMLPISVLILGILLFGKLQLGWFAAKRHFVPHNEGVAFQNVMAAFFVGMFAYICAPFIAVFTISWSFVPWKSRIGAFAMGLVACLKGILCGGIVVALLKFLSD